MLGATCAPFGQLCPRRNAGGDFLVASHLGAVRAGAPARFAGKNPQNVTGYTLRIPLRSERGSPHPNPLPPTRSSKELASKSLHFEDHQVNTGTEPSSCQ